MLDGEKGPLNPGKSKRAGKQMPATGLNLDRFDLGALDNARSVQLIARDTFVAETAVKVDQLQIEIRALTRDLADMRSKIAELNQETERNYRFATFQDGEQRTRFSKVEDLSRRFNNLQARFEAIEGPRGGAPAPFTNFEAISRRLAEFSVLQKEFRNVKRNLSLSAGLFCGSVALWLATLLAR